jgi:hypothetical protein
LLAYSAVENWGVPVEKPEFDMRGKVTYWTIVEK